MNVEGTAGADAPWEVARRFVRAIARGEHTLIWELLAPEARERAIRVAVGNGLDRVRAQRLRDGMSDPEELDDFLRHLLGGLRRDLRSVEVDRLVVGQHPQRHEDGSVAVDLHSPSAIPGTGDWPAGVLYLREQAPGCWLVARLEPVIAGP